MKFLAFIFILLVFIPRINSQEISSQTYYEISLIDRPQVIQLYHYSDDSYKGLIITKVTKGKWSRNWINKAWRKLWKLEDQQITNVYKIDNTITKTLITKLKKQGIETLKEKCILNKNCSEIHFLDGDTVYFNIKTKEKERSYYFTEIHPINNNNAEDLELRKQAQILITTLYEYLDLNDQFSSIFKSLPKGNYYYSRGSGIIQIKNR